MYQYTNKNTVVNTSNYSEHAELTYKKMIERIEGAADDFHNAYELLNSTVGLIKCEKMDDNAKYLVEKLSADCHDALALSKHLEAIADFSDTTEKAVSALYALIRKGGFGIDCWNIMQGTVDAVNALDECGVGLIKATDPDTGDERVVYCAAEFSPRAMFAHVTELRYYMAHQMGAVDPAGPLCQELKILDAERADMLSAYNALLECAPEDLSIGKHKYAIGLIALVAAIQALNLLIVRGEALGSSECADKLWRKYCQSAEAIDAKTTVISAMQLCPIGIF